MASESERFPSETISDWKSYADHLVVYQVADERQLEPDAETAARGEGAIGRKVTVKIEDVLWSASGAPNLPVSLEMSATGWALHDGEKIPMLVEGAPRAEVGDRILAPLFRLEDPGTMEWGPVAGAAQLRLVSGRAEQAPAGEHNAARRSLSGLTVAEIARAWRQAMPDPRAAAHSDLRPAERVKVVTRERTEAPATHP